MSSFPVAPGNGGSSVAGGENTKVGSMFETDWGAEMRAIAMAIVAAGIMVSGAILTAAAAFSSGGPSSNLNAVGVVIMVVGATVAYFATATGAPAETEMASSGTHLETEDGR